MTGLFNLGMMEIVLVLAVAFLIVGPKDLPRVARWMARQIRHIKEFVKQIKAETGWDELMKDVQETKDEVETVMKDADVRKEVEQTADELRAEMEGVNAEVDFLSREIKKDIES